MSDQDTSIFTPTDTPTEDKVVNPTSNEQFATLLAEIKEEGRQKYQDVETALKSIPHAQEHIKQLQAELSELREQVSKQMSAEEVLAKIEATSKATGTPSNVELDVDKIVEIVNSQLSAREIAERSKSNTQAVISKMRDVYGEKAEEIYVKAAKDSNISIEEMNKLSKTSPAAVFKLVGIKDSASSNIPPKTSSSVNTETLTPQEPVKSSKVQPFATTTDLVNAWRNAKR